MTKENVSVTVDPKVAQYLNRPGVNASGKINDLVEQEMTAGTSERQMLKLREEQLEGDVEDIENSLKTKKKLLKNVRSRLGELDEQQQENYEEMLRKVDRVPDDPENGYVQEVAEELDMTGEEVLEESKKL